MKDELDVSNVKILYTSDARPITEWMERELERIAKNHGDEVEVKIKSCKPKPSAS